MYASFLLKYSKSYLHTCVTYMFILSCRALARAHADVSHPSHRAHSSHSPKRPSDFSPLIFSQLSLFLSFLFLSLVLSLISSLFFVCFIRHRSSTMNTVRYESAIKRREGNPKRKEKKSRRRVPRGSWHVRYVRLFVYMYNALYFVRMCLCICLSGAVRMYVYACI